MKCLSYCDLHVSEGRSCAQSVLFDILQTSELLSGRHNGNSAETGIVAASLIEVVEVQVFQTEICSSLVKF